MILTTVIFMDLLAGMELDLFVPSFPELQYDFDLAPFWVEALLSVNFIGYCISLFFVGSLADRFGRKPVILLGLTIFIIGSLFCLWAKTYSFLLIGRFLQGVGVAAPAILSFLIIADSYPLKKQQFLMAMLNASMNASIAIAPILGSYVTLYFHWQGNFFMLLSLGIAVLGMTALFIPSYKLPKHKETLSLRAYLPIFQSRHLMLLITFIVLVFEPYWIFVGMSPILYMEDLNVPLSHFGFYQGALAFVFALGSLFSGFILHRFEHKKLLIISKGLTIFGLISILFVTFFNSTNPMLITVAFIPFIISQIIPNNILLPLCLNFKPKAKGRVSAVVQALRLIFSALSLQIAGYFYDGSFQKIGILLSGFIFFGIIALFFVINNTKLMNFHHEA